eukprot:scaffold3872_cov123-Isochrysis_galbana.AAC.3
MLAWRVRAESPHTSVYGAGCVTQSRLRRGALNIHKEGAALFEPLALVGVSLSSSVTLSCGRTHDVRPG